MKKKRILFISLLFLMILSGCSSISKEEYDANMQELEDLKVDFDMKIRELDRRVKELNELRENYNTLEAENKALSVQVEEYEKIIEPYKELTKSEIEAKTQKAKLEKKEAANKLKEMKAAEKKAKQEKEARQKAEEEAKQKQGYNTGITYQQLARTPDKYENEKVKFSGKVIQVLEETTTTTLRLAVNSNYDQIILLKYYPSLVSSRILEDDYITIYGTSEGIYTYQSVMGGNITVPLVRVEKIDQ